MSDDDAAVPGDRVADMEAVPAGSTYLFTLLEDGQEREAILVRTDDAGDDPDGTATAVPDGGAEGGDGAPAGVAAWINECQHFTHIGLDKGSGAQLRGGEVLCANHGAMFDAASGRCTVGPCEGAYLEPVPIAVRDGTVYLADPDLSFVREGPVERDPVDLTSTSNVEF